MKIASILTFVATLSAIQALAQGTITFNATVRNPDGTPVTSSQGYRAELLYAPDGTPTDIFSATAVRLGVDVPVGVPVAGAVTGGTRTAPTTTPGGFGLFQVIVWRGSPNATFGLSPIVRVDTGDPTTIPPQTPAPLPIPPIILIPEPSVIALTLLGAGACLMLRPRVAVR